MTDWKIEFHVDDSLLIDLEDQVESTINYCRLYLNHVGITEVAYLNEYGNGSIYLRLNGIDEISINRLIKSLNENKCKLVAIEQVRNK